MLIAESFLHRFSVILGTKPCQVTYIKFLLKLCGPSFVTL